MPTILALALFCFLPLDLQAAEPPPKDVSALLAPVIQKHNVPGMAAAVVQSGETVALGAAGVRTRGKPDQIDVADRVHIGSDTKSMTAMLCGILVDDGKLKWDQTLGETFPELKKSMHPRYQAVTLEQLLAHRGGALDPGFLANARNPFVATSRRVTGLASSAILETARVNVVASAKERAKQRDLLLRRRKPVD